MAIPVGNEAMAEPPPAFSVVVRATTPYAQTEATRLIADVAAGLDEALGDIGKTAHTHLKMKIGNLQPPSMPGTRMARAPGFPIARGSGCLERLAPYPDLEVARVPDHLTRGALFHIWGG